MSRGRSAFRKRDIIRGVEAVRAAGVEVERVDFGNDGSFSVVVAKPGEALNTADANPWDEVLTDATDKKRPS